MRHTEAEWSRTGPGTILQANSSGIAFHIESSGTVVMGDTSNTVSRNLRV